MSEIKNILFIIPDERKVYETVNVKTGAFHLPSLAFAILGSIAKKNQFNPIIVDMSLYDNPYEALRRQILDCFPIYVGITCTSATFYQAISTSRFVKEIIPTTEVLIGGPHVSSLIEETLDYDCFDYLFIGEAEESLEAFLKGIDPKKIDGIGFKDENGKVCISPNKSYLRNLDNYPFPDYSLYDLTKYHISRLHAKNNPVVWIETTRGCPFDCQICNKVVHGQTFRAKSIDRVISEIEYFLKQGIKEFHIADDGFTSDMKRAEKICDEIILRKLSFTWSCVNGIRVDRVNQRLLDQMKKAGCYRISFGIESGNQDILDHLGKRVTLKQVENAVNMAKKAGLEVFGFFMFGFEDDTEETMKDTINFAKKLPLDLAKATIVIPFPGSPLYTKYKALDLIYPTDDYRHFNAYIPPKLVYKHPSLNWDIIEKYHEMFYRSFYFNPIYIIRRLYQSLKTGSVYSDVKLVLKMKWFG